MNLQKITFYNVCKSLCCPVHPSRKLETPHLSDVKCRVSLTLAIVYLPCRPDRTLRCGLSEIVQDKEHLDLARWALVQTGVRVVWV